MQVRAQWGSGCMQAGHKSAVRPAVNSIPFAYNMDGLNAISFDKGCYLGQELIARTHYTGVVRRRLVPFVAQEGGSVWKLCCLSLNDACWHGLCTACPIWPPNRHYCKCPSKGKCVVLMSLAATIIEPFARLQGTLFQAAPQSKCKVLPAARQEKLATL